MREGQGQVWSRATPLSNCPNYCASSAGEAREVPSRDPL